MKLVGGLTYALAGLFAMCAIGCGEPLAPDGAKLEIVSGEAQAWYAGRQLKDSLIVRVLDANGASLSGKPVTFEVVVGNGTLSPGGQATATVTTNGQGRAAVAWFLGDSPLTQRVEARVGTAQGGPPLVATFVAQSISPPFREIVRISSDQVGSVAGTPVAESLAVRVTNRDRDGIPGYFVFWKVVSGDGTISATRVVTDADGYAKVQATSGVTVGATTGVLATVGDESTGGVSTGFSVYSAAMPVGTLTITFGDKQGGAAGQELGLRLRVHATTLTGQPNSGESIT